MEKLTTIFGDFNTLLSLIEISSKQKISKDTFDLSNTASKLDLIDICRILHLITAKYIFLSGSHSPCLSGHSPWKITFCVIKSTLAVLKEKAMAPHSSTLAWKIPWAEEPGRLQFMGSLRVRYNWVTSLSLFTFMFWKRKWQPTPVFLPGESQGKGTLVGCRLWGCTESDTTEVT